MDKLKNLEDLFYHQLKDIYSAEEQLLNVLPSMREESSHKELKDAFSQHLKETEKQKNRLDEIGQSLGIDLSGDTCEAMKGLIREAKSFISEDADSDVRDAGIIADAQRVEHYEISAYGTAIQFAQALNKKDVAEKLKQTIDEEKNADKILSQLATDNINKHAKKQKAGA